MTTTESAGWHVRSPFLDDFIAAVELHVVEAPDPAERVRRLRPAFGRLLADHTWLPDDFTQPDPGGGMAAGLGSYLIYRSASRDLSLMSLVVPAGGATPVHDHLAWGLVGLYSGEQQEVVFRRLDGGSDEGHASLEEVERRRLHQGDFCDLLPPEGDIHQVQTLGDKPSVSLHLLGNDIGCIWRHRFEPEARRVQRFRSGYSNEPCIEDSI